MNYKEKLITGTIREIYKNLILDVELENGEMVQALCPETDFHNMLYAPGMPVYLTRSADKRRRVSYICQMVKHSESLIFVNYKYKNNLFMEAFARGIMREDFGEYTCIRFINPFEEDLKRVNFELSGANGIKACVYVVNIYNKQGTEVVFPSVINFFELEMFEELRRMRREGMETFVCLIVPREDCMDARFVWSQSPVAAAKIYDEVKNGLKFCCYGCNVSEKSVSISKRMRILH